MSQALNSLRTKWKAFKSVHQSKINDSIATWRVKTVLDVHKSVKYTRVNNLRIKILGNFVNFDLL